MYVKHLARCQAYLANTFQSHPARLFHRPCHRVTCLDVQGIGPLVGLLADEGRPATPRGCLSVSRRPGNRGVGSVLPGCGAPTGRPVRPGSEAAPPWEGLIGDLPAAFPMARVPSARPATRN